MIKDGIISASHPGPIPARVRGGRTWSGFAGFRNYPVNGPGGSPFSVVHPGPQVPVGATGAWYRRYYVPRLPRPRQSRPASPELSESRNRCRSGFPSGGVREVSYGRKYHEIPLECQIVSGYNDPNKYHIDPERGGTAEWAADKKRE